MPKTVGSLAYFDLHKVPLELAKVSRIKYICHCSDAKSSYVVRYYLRNNAHLHRWVRKYRNKVRRHGHVFSHLRADGEFDTEALGDLASERADMGSANPCAH